MNEIPEIPTPPPEVPRGKLWTSLLIPPVVTILLSLWAGLTGNQSVYFGVPELLMYVMIISLGIFVRAWRVRYIGSSLVLTAFGFFLGQFILCLGLWFGCCALYF